MNIYRKIGLSAFSGITFVAIILIFSLKKDTKSGFLRNMISEKPKILNKIELAYDSYYIAGFCNKKLILGNYVAPMHTIQVDTGNFDSFQKKLPVSYDISVEWASIRLQFDSSHIFLAERRSPAIIISKYPGYHEDIKTLGDLKFDLVRMISPQSIIVRRYEFSAKQKVLQKIVLGQTISRQQTFMPGHLNRSVFLNDGFLTYDTGKDLLFYTCYYRNEFLCLDTNLNLIYRARTIDTVKNGNVKVAEIKIKNGMENAMSAPPVQVNKRGCANGRYLYINSALASDMETKAEFKRYIVIDVYEVMNGGYVHSFVIPASNGQLSFQFEVKGDKLFALYSNALIKYQLPKVIRQEN